MAKTLTPAPEPEVKAPTAAEPEAAAAPGQPELENEEQKEALEGMEHDAFDPEEAKREIQEAIEKEREVRAKEEAAINKLTAKQAAAEARRGGPGIRSTVKTFSPLEMGKDIARSAAIGAHDDNIKAAQQGVDDAVNKALSTSKAVEQKAAERQSQAAQQEDLESSVLGRRTLMSKYG